MSPLDHLAELRKRLIYSFIAIFVAFAISWFFVEHIFHIMMLPMIEVLGPERKMIFINPTEAFITYLKVAALAGFMIATPFWLFQIWQFIGPGLYIKERRYVFGFVVFGTLFFVGGAVFGYFKIIPLGLKFLIDNFQSDYFEAFPTLKETFALSTKLLLAFGISFELPLVIFFLARLGIVSHGWLLRNFKYAVLVIFIAAAVFTPPDVVTQIGLGIPLCLLYLLGVGVAFVFGKRRK
jgi:sec-independent protein translocase protein TatC